LAGFIPWNAFVLWTHDMLLSFTDCTLDVTRRELRQRAELVAVEPQVFDLLIYAVAIEYTLVDR
jgi:DNA-binding winged helix-turn-helix (wHTH) protein